MNSEERHAEALPRLEEVRPKAAGSHAQPEYDRVDTVSPSGGTQVAEEVPTSSASMAESPSDASLFAADELAGLRARWGNVQAGFVDDPRDCVQKADGLVSDVVEQLTAGFGDARSRLEQQWGRGEEASTEDLRIALRRYRDFFDRLLAV